ncbi:MAG: PF20097 family protein [Thermodesulfobacteriota bacterium]
MSNKKELIIPATVLIVIGTISLYFIFSYLDDFIYYKNLKNEGIKTGAVLSYKGVEVDGVLQKKKNTLPSDRHYINVKFATESGENIKCRVGVSKNTYDSMSRRDELRVIYLKSNPENCSLPNSVSTLYTLSLSLIAISLIFLLIFIGFLIYVIRSFKKPAMPLPLTTVMNVDTQNVNCPECGAKMINGYMPTIGGVSWRDRNDAVGIPTLFSGLPGTTFWFKRPMLHGFHCKNCKIITFKYGSKKKGI